MKKNTKRTALSTPDTPARSIANPARPLTREERHKTFGGFLYEADFNTEYKGNASQDGSTIANRIASSMRFDETYANRQVIWQTQW
ncbi:hypothetical protein C0033_07305 [Clostridium sp. chh4-2]|uniref:hypothetical protein n=1 Tax=Clostridium sp. chh4-2 TaxID=2067550 RepID=UPI000CCF21B6|nr:hypothetical protein [Clostridium sp. chh4-2]PNV62815.1 hypothetical protein C0033_07305 [Clostridium sp. chh4-2]